jgi:hypothetical protein
MSRHEVMRRLAVTGAIIAGAMAVGSEIHLPHFHFGVPGMSAPEPHIDKITTKGRLKSVDNKLDVLLTEGVGDSVSTLQGEMAYTGIRGFLNHLPKSKDARALHTTVTQDGRLSIGLRAHSLHDDPSGNERSAIVNVSGIFTIVESLGATRTQTQDGIVAQIRGGVHPGDTKRDQRGDGLEWLGRVAFPEQCGQPLIGPVFDESIKGLVRWKRDLPEGTPIKLTYLDKDGNRTTLGAYQLPSQTQNTAEQIAKSLLEGKEEDHTRIDNVHVVDDGCTIEPRAKKQIEELINGKPSPEPEQ